MPIKLQKWIRRSDLQANRETLYVFGDNIRRVGYGGQAKEMRGEPNAIGIPTKWSPGIYASDAQALTFIREWVTCFENLDYYLGAIHGDVIWPEDGIGTGLAAMETHAPLLWITLEMLRKNLFRQYF